MKRRTNRLLSLNQGAAVFLLIGYRFKKLAKETLVVTQVMGGVKNIKLKEVQTKLRKHYTSSKQINQAWIESQREL